MSHNEMASKHQLFLPGLLYSETIGQDPCHQRVYNAKIDQQYLLTPPAPPTHTGYISKCNRVPVEKKC